MEVSRCLQIGTRGRVRPSDSYFPASPEGPRTLRGTNFRAALQTLLRKLKTSILSASSGLRTVKSAAEVAQRPLDSLVGRKGGCTGKGQLKGPDTRSTRHRNSGPQIDAATSLAITMALQKVDLSGRSNALYDSRDAEVRAKEDVAPAMSILRSWIRKQGLRPLDIFQSWDHSQDYALTRKELRAGLAQFGLRLSKDLVTLIFDDIAAGFHMTYDELRDWLEGTAKAENLTEEERQWQAAKIIQKYIRARLVKLAAKKAAAT